MTPCILNLGAWWRCVVIFYYAAELVTSPVHWISLVNLSVECAADAELFL